METIKILTIVVLAIIGAGIIGLGIICYIGKLMTYFRQCGGGTHNA